MPSSSIGDKLNGGSPVKNFTPLHLQQENGRICEETITSTTFYCSNTDDPNNSTLNGIQSDIQSFSLPSQTYLPSTQTLSLSQQFSQGSGLLPGEELEDENSTVDMINCALWLTTYRIIITSHNQDTACSIPLTDVESIESKDLTGLNITCKDGRIIRLKANSSDIALTWYKKLISKTCTSRDLRSIFAFRFCSAVYKDKPRLRWLRIDMRDAHQISNLTHEHHDPAYEALHREFKQLRLPDTDWRITIANKRFELCSTYPQYLIVPYSCSDEELRIMKNGRFHARFPTLSWRYRKNGAVLLRSSQPIQAFFGMMTNHDDVKLYERITALTKNENTSKFLIVDARSYTAALANRTKGGGYETTDVYSNADVEFMGLPNIHNIRYSFDLLRKLLNSNPDASTYFQSLQSTLWLQNIGQLFKAVERCLKAITKEGISVLVHCSDGWDRTTQIVSLCMLIGDQFYRTFDGFKVLIQRQWIEYGHKFADRLGILNGDIYEISPVFLQFLDCVYQLWEKNPDCFQFNRRYLMKLLQHAYSGLFGDFLFNSAKEASDGGYHSCLQSEAKETNGDAATQSNHRLFSIWDYLGKHNDEFHNPAFTRRQRSQLRYPIEIPDLLLWRDAYCYLPSYSFINNPDDHTSSFGASAGTGSSHDITEKSMNALSRSQSASSLTSLEQNTHGSGMLFNATFGPPSSVTMSNTLVAHNSSATKLETIHMGLPEPQNACQMSLDVDGLSRVPMMFEDRMIERMREFQNMELQRSKASPMSSTTPAQAIPHSNSYLMHGLNGIKNSRTRNESVDSTSFEFVSGECCRQKHNSSSTIISNTSVLPSSCSSNCTTLSEICPSSTTSTNSTVT